MPWTKTNGLANRARWVALLALCVVNVVLLTTICTRVSVRAQQKPVAPGTPGYVAPVAVKPATPAATPAAAVPAESAPAPAIAKAVSAPARTIIVLDPAHGGAETGAQINDHLAEKDVTLALATRLRSALQSHNFTIVTTRDGDPAGGLTTVQRAEIANHTSAVACLVLHATASGNGVHLFTSPLQPAGTKRGVLPWATAQAAFAQQSAALQKELNTALTNSHFVTVSTQAAIAPLNNLTCPAIAIELSPLLAADSGDTTAVSDADYQQHVAESITTALVFWRGKQSGAAQ